ncbi:hypothetical protein FXV91_04855 [Methanosarcina sp. DH2]|jgi:hypothetical protein|uniref:hypothetical protein n=1 Tax=Methanosarcina sp. DH2 TaxID=2605639 RepID=UPI001E64733A|nr:hypothetical protein [Methanosarcina sp. DH2]MCC4769551.1 hypothetical protein [Methanosarcina sp. DH2]
MKKKGKNREKEEKIGRKKKKIGRKKKKIGRKKKKAVKGNKNNFGRYLLFISFSSFSGNTRFPSSSGARMVFV